MKGIILFLSVPAHCLGRKVYAIVPHNRQAGHVVIGVVIMASGSTLACNIPHGIPHVLHVLLDMIAYGVHGFGAAPLVAVLARKLKIEI